MVSPFLLIAGLALAQDTVEPPVDDFEGVEEIWVFPDLEVEAARHEVIRVLKDQGYTMEKDKGEYVRFRHVTPWKGEIRLYDEGYLIIKRQPVRVEGPEVPWAERNSVGAWAGCVLYPFLCVRPGGQLISRRKFQPVTARAAFVTDPTLDELAGRIADAGTAARIEELPGRLEALWYDGVPLQEEGAEPLPAVATYAERRLALYAFWESRTDTEWGDRVRLAVEAFIRAEVQTSEHPFTDEEIAELEAARGCVRSFQYVRRGGASGPLAMPVP